MIQTTLNILHLGGLSTVDIPILGRDGSIQGWDSITVPGKLHKTVIQRNINHLQQASPTLLGSGEGYDLFHGDKRHQTAEAVLTSNLEWKYPTDEVNQQINQIQWAYNKDELKEEADVINCLISDNKDESTELLPSGRHIVHYK